jgi:hypothetical protein
VGLTNVQAPGATRHGEVPWIEPYPDALLESALGAPPGPEARYEQAEAISLAFVTALQLLPSRQAARLPPPRRRHLGLPRRQPAAPPVRRVKGLRGRRFAEAISHPPFQ